MNCTCGAKTNQFSGIKDAPILFICSYPAGEYDQPIHNYELLQKECARFGLSMQSFRVGYLYGHPCTSTLKTCVSWGIERCVKEAHGRKLVVLVGADAVHTLSNLKVSETSSLILNVFGTHSKYLSSPIMPLTMPSIVGTIGETRLAIQRIKEFLNA